MNTLNPLLCLTSLRASVSSCISGSQQLRERVESKGLVAFYGLLLNLLPDPKNNYRHRVAARVHPPTPEKQPSSSSVESSDPYTTHPPSHYSLPKALQLVKHYQIPVTTPVFVQARHVLHPRLRALQVVP